MADPEPVGRNGAACARPRSSCAAHQSRTVSAFLSYLVAGMQFLIIEVFGGLLCAAGNVAALWGCFVITMTAGLAVDLQLNYLFHHDERHTTKQRYEFLCLRVPRCVAQKWQKGGSLLLVLTAPIMKAVGLTVLTIGVHLNCFGDMSLTGDTVSLAGTFVMFLADPLVMVLAELPQPPPAQASAAAADVQHIRSEPHAYAEGLMC
ncbi:hypothetical protein T492DRAFT_327484 [Pavlovales sp. CCMP2436]|nr:hypothetical protein T492DRAFT_327484 [Pavlovales sp. CCMP2436]